MIQPANVQLTYSQHAIREANSDRYGKIDLPTQAVVGPAGIVEVEEYSGRVEKFVFRAKYNEKIDLVFAVIPEGKGRLFVKTVWANEVGDHQNTLDTRRYEQKP